MHITDANHLNLNVKVYFKIRVVSNQEYLKMSTNKTATMLTTFKKT